MKRSKNKRASTFTKNHQRYFKLLLKKEFKMGLWLIADVFRFPKIDLENKFPPIEKEGPRQALKRVKKLHLMAQEERLKFFRGLNSEKRKSFGWL